MSTSMSVASIATASDQEMRNECYAAAAVRHLVVVKRHNFCDRIDTIDELSLRKRVKGEDGASGGPSGGIGFVKKEEPMVGILLGRRLLIKEAVGDNTFSIFLMTRFFFMKMLRNTFVLPVKMFQSEYNEDQQNRFLLTSVPLQKFFADFIVSELDVSAEPSSMKDIMMIVNKWANDNNIKETYLDEIKNYINQAVSKNNTDKVHLQLLKKHARADQFEV